MAARGLDTPKRLTLQQRNFTISSFQTAFLLRVAAAWSFRASSCFSISSNHAFPRSRVFTFSCSADVSSLYKRIESVVVPAGQGLSLYVTAPSTPIHFSTAPHSEPAVSSAVHTKGIRGPWVGVVICLIRFRGKSKVRCLAIAPYLGQCSSRQPLQHLRIEQSRAMQHSHHNHSVSGDLEDDPIMAE